MPRGRGKRRRGGADPASGPIADGGGGGVGRKRRRNSSSVAVADAPHEKKEEEGAAVHPLIVKMQQQKQQQKKPPPPQRTNGMRRRAGDEAQRLQGSRFRWLNEQLYTTRGDAAHALFQSDPSLFMQYHAGFRTAVQKWPLNPVDAILRLLRACPCQAVVADFGCGDAAIARALDGRTVHSFDLNAVNEHVVACDMADVPLDDASVDVGVFSLSLMGTNWPDFVMEAHRVLKPKGRLLVAEVKSRIPHLNAFIDAFRQMGFNRRRVDDSNKMFVLLELQKDTARAAVRCDYTLRPCLYKRR